MSKNKTRIKQLVESVILAEDDGGGDGGGDSSYGTGYPSGLHGGMGGGYEGAGNASPWTDPLITTFVRPLTDIFNTAVYGVKNLTASAVQTLKYLVTNVPKLIVLFMKTDNWEVIKKNLDDKLSKLHSRYAGVIHRNLDMLKDHDLQGMAFFLDPTLFLGAKLTQFSPEITTEVFEVLGLDMDHVLHHTHPKPHLNPDNRKHWWNQEKDFAVFESIIFEDTLPEISEESQKEIKLVRQEILSAIFEATKEVLNADYSQLIKILGSKGSALQQQLSKGFKNKAISIQDVDGSKQVVVIAVKKEYKKQVLSQLEQLKQQVPSANSDIDKLIAQINSISIQ
jgi:hypothetical protein